MLITLRGLRNIINEASLQRRRSIINQMRAVAAEKIAPIKIGHVIGMGQFGIAYRLSNNNVLKIFVDPVGNQIAYYRAVQDKLFGGKGTKTMPMVYDVAHLGRDPKSRSQINMVELEFLDATDENEQMQYWLRALDSLMSERLIIDVVPQKDDNYWNYLVDELSKRQFVQKVRKLINDYDRAYRNIPTKIVQQYLSAFYDAIKLSGNSQLDMHSGNIGKRASGQLVAFDTVI